jgi:tyrosyl-tRNA synthetase
VMEAYGLDPQVVLTTPLINSWDGSKMSGSKGNYIALVADPNEQFGKAMRLPDDMLDEYFRLVVESEERPEDPLQAKLALARFVVGRAHGEDAAQAAEEHFTRVVREGQPPEQVEDVELPHTDPVHLPRLLVDGLQVGSASEARRLISQGAVRLDGEPVTELDVPRETLEGRLLQVGKRRFARLTP